VDDTDDGESQYNETHVDDYWKVICQLVNLVAADGFGEVEHYVDHMCGFFFETRIDCGNMVSIMFDEALKGDATIVAARYEAVGTAHETICHLATIDGQEQDKVIEEFLMRISTNIKVEDNLHAVEKKANIDQEALTEESHMKDFLTLFLNMQVFKIAWEKKLKSRLLINLMQI